MAGSINKAILVGRLGKDPDVRRTNDGRPIVNLSIATADRWTDKATGEKREHTEWHHVVIFSEGLCRVAEQYLRKGSNVYIEGSLRTNKWTDQAGVERYTTNIVLQGYGATLTMLDGPNDERQATPRRQSGDSDFAGDRQRTPVKRQTARADMSDMRDDIPFAPEWR